jgi:hypothetical protein
MRSKEAEELDKNTKWIVDYFEYVFSKDPELSNEAGRHASKMEDIRIKINNNKINEKN